MNFKDVFALAKSMSIVRGLVRKVTPNAFAILLFCVAGHTAAQTRNPVVDKESVASNDDTRPASRAIPAMPQGIGYRADGKLYGVGERNKRARRITSDGNIKSIVDGPANGNASPVDASVPTISIADLTVVEGNAGNTYPHFTVSLSAPTTVDVTFGAYTTAGSATWHTDFTGFNHGYAVIPAGQTSLTLEVGIFGDSIPEPDETFRVNLTGVSGAILTMEGAEAIGKILNDDGPGGSSVTTLSVGDVSISEGSDGTKVATFTVKLSEPVPGSVIYDISTSDGTAKAGSDYVANRLYSQFIDNEPRTFSVTINGDTLPEADETFYVTISNVFGVEVRDGQAAGTIRDDDPSSLPRLSIADARVLEGKSGSKSLAFTASLTTPSVIPVSFNVATSDGTAVAGVDYTSTTLTGISIAPGQVSTVVNIPILGDTIPEANEWFALTLGNVLGATLSDESVTGQILNDDGTMLVSAPQDPTSPLADNYSTEAAITPDGRFVAFSSRANNLSFPFTPGSSPTQYDVYVRDTINGTTTLVSAAIGGGRGNLDSSDPSISDDGRYVVFVSNASNLVANDSYNRHYDVFRRDMLTGTTELVTVPFDGVGGGNDDSSGPKISGNGRHVVFTSMAYNLLANDLNYGIPDVMVRDMETGVTSLATIPYDTSRGGTGGMPGVAISRDGRYIGFASRHANLVPFDYPCPPDFPCTKAYWRDMVTGITQWVAVWSDGDEMYPASSNVSSISPDGRWVSFNSNLNKLLYPNDGFGDVFIRDMQNFDVYVVSQGMGGQLSNQTSSSAAISPDGTQISFRSNASNLVENDTNGVSDIFVRPLAGIGITRLTAAADGVSQANDESFYTASSNDAHRVAFATRASNLIVGDTNGVDDIVLFQDGVSPPRLSIGDVSISEGNNGTKVATFTVGLSETLSSAVSYSITTSDGTATAGSDYVARSLNNESIPAGSTSKTFSVTINGDTTAEPSETFNVSISNVAGAALADGQATGTIVNDDGAMLPTLSVADVSIREGNSGVSVATFTVLLSRDAPVGGVSFNIATGNIRSTGNVATANSDFATVGSKTIMIAAGETSASFAVKILGDTRMEGNEVFNVIISNANGATIARAEAVGMIINDDYASLQDSNNDTTTPDGITAIAAIQGSGMLSPLMGEHVTARGVVTAVRQDGFFLQAPDSERDADQASSDAIFVFTGTLSNKKASRGNLVEVSGQVREVAYHSRQKELSTTSIEAAQVTLLASGHKLPQPIVLNASMLRSDRAATWLERFESMRVSMPKMLVVSPVGGRINDATAASVSDGRFYGVAYGTARPFREPGIPARKIATLGGVGKVTVFDENPERLHVDSLGQAGSIAMSVDVGDVISGVAGILAQANDSYSLFTDTDAKFHVASGATPRSVSVPLASDFTIGNINARRFFDDVDDLEVKEPVLTKNAYALRLAKTANAICDYMHSPDIVGIAEVEKQSTLSDLAEAVNSNAGNVLFPGACQRNPAYSALMNKGNVGNGSLGFLVSTVNVRPGVPRVKVLGVIEEGRSARFKRIDGSSEALFERPPLLLRAQLNKAKGDSETLTVIVNQLQSVAAIDDSEPASYGWPTRADYADAKRRAQMQFLAALLDARQSLHEHERIVMMGGFESNEFSNGKDDPMGLIASPLIKPEGLTLAGAVPTRQPLSNMTLLMPKAERYSVSRDGNAEALDHILVNQALINSRFLLRTEFARINADFGEDNAGDFSVPVRVSEHDAVVLYLSEKGGEKRPE